MQASRDGAAPSCPVLSPDSQIRVLAAVLVDADGRLLLCRRPIHKRHGGLWEFPGGKLEDGETSERCLERELEEELGVRSRVGDFLCSVPFSGALMAFELLVFRTELLSDSFRLTDHDEVRWQAPGDMDEALFSEPDRPVVRLLQARRPA